MFDYYINTKLAEPLSYGSLRHNSKFVISSVKSKAGCMLFKILETFVIADTSVPESLYCVYFFKNTYIFYIYYLHSHVFSVK